MMPTPARDGMHAVPPFADIRIMRANARNPTEPKIDDL